MAKVYVITCGEYLDYHICTVCSTRERAEELRPLYSDRYDIAEIEEFEMDKAPNDVDRRMIAMDRFAKALAEQLGV